ncbi:MAG: GntR family transcriptional regulator [Lysobacterales bacterium]
MSAAMEKAYKALREAIVKGQVKPGDRLKERQICEDLKVSRTPVREALRRLAADGLVQLEPRRGGVVTQLSRAEANEIFSLGALLESHAARLAASRATGSDHDMLKEKLAAMKQVLSSGDGSSGEADSATYLTLDHEFHEHIVAMAASRRLADMLRLTVGLPVLVKAFAAYSSDDLQRSLQQHHTIADAIISGDPDWAEAAMRSHVLVARSMTLAEFADDTVDPPS